MSVVCSIRDEILDRSTRTASKRIEYATIVKVLASSNIVVHGVSKELANELQSLPIASTKGTKTQSDIIQMDHFTYVLNTMANHGWKVITTYNNSIMLERTVSLLPVEDVMSS